MSRRVQANLNGELDSKNYYSESMDQIYSYYSSEQSTQENYDYGTSYDYSNNQNSANEAPQAYEAVHNNQYSRNNINVSAHETNYISFNNVTPNQNIQTRHAPMVQASFPVVQPPPLVQQISPASNSGVQYNYGTSSEKSWISAFSSGCFDNEPPLLEGIHLQIYKFFDYFVELGINFSHIKDKVNLY